MNEKDIYDEAIDLLEQISEDADYFAEQIGPTDGAIVVQRLAAFRKQAATIQRENQLLALCSSLHKFIEEMPVLRDLLIPEDSDVDQMQKDRFFTIEGFNKTSAQQQADSKALGTLQQQLTKTQEKLEAHIKRLEELQAKNEQNQ